MEWITTAKGLIELIVGLIGLIGTGFGTFFAIKNWIKLNKEKSAKEIWNTIMTTADAAMKDLENSTLKGKDKKSAVISAVKESCKAAGLEIDPFIDQLSAYIDQSIAWFNSMKK